MSEKVDDGENLGSSRCSSACDLPEIFLCFVHGRLYPKRYERQGEDSWDVHAWRDHWDYIDNVGDKTAVEDFYEAWHKFRIIWPEEYGE